MQTIIVEIPYLSGMQDRTIQEISEWLEQLHNLYVKEYNKRNDGSAKVIACLMQCVAEELVNRL